MCLRGSCAFRLIVGKANGDGRRNGQAGSGQGTGAGSMGGAMGGDMGQGGGARVLYGRGAGCMLRGGALASASKLCNCVIYDMLPQYFAATSFRYLFGVKRCYFGF